MAASNVVYPNLDEINELPRRNLRKIEQRCDERVNVLEREAAEKKSSIECTQRKERRALTQVGLWILKKNG